MEHQITWYWLNQGDLPTFAMPKGDSAIAINETNFEILTSTPQVTLPLFDLNGDRDSIIQGIFTRVQNLLKPFRPSSRRIGYLIGVVRYIGPFVRDPNKSLHLQLGLIITQNPITPCFRDSNDTPGIVRKVDPFECLGIGLPMSDAEYVYRGPRPSRFEREDVI